MPTAILEVDTELLENSVENSGVPASKYSVMSTSGQVEFTAVPITDFATAVSGQESTAVGDHSLTA